MQSFLDKNCKALLTHFIKKGYCALEGHAEYLFHRNDSLVDCSFENIDNIITSLCENKPGFDKKMNTGPNVGGVIFQRWNITNTKKQDVIQIGKKNEKILRYCKKCNEK